MESIAAENGIPLCFICDHALSHRTAASDPQNVLPNLGQHQTIFLPPHSTFLNLVDNAISAFKANLKQELENIRPNLLKMETEEREAMLTKLADQSVASLKFLHVYTTCIQKIE